MASEKIFVLTFSKNGLFPFLTFAPRTTRFLKKIKLRLKEGQRKKQVFSMGKVGSYMLLWKRDRMEGPTGVRLHTSL
jgi:hypothetical protein